MDKRKNLIDNEEIQTLLEDSGEDSSDFEEDEPCMRDAVLDSYLQTDYEDLDLNSSFHSESNFSENSVGKSDSKNSDISRHTNQSASAMNVHSSP